MKNKKIKNNKNKKKIKIFWYNIKVKNYWIFCAIKKNFFLV